MSWPVPSSSARLSRSLATRSSFDVRYKSEGLVSLHEWDEEEAPPKPGDEVEVLLEGMDDETGEVVLSRKKRTGCAARERVVSNHREGDVVTGKVTRKIKGGLLVDIGINAFLPASQVDIRRPPDIADYLDREVRCVILSIDEDQRNIVVSRRSLIETERVALREQLLADIAVGQVPHRYGEEPRRLRCLRRPRRHRRPAPYHRYGLGSVSSTQASGCASKRRST